ncbi:small glutamine-rich tetratricopeptide repeat-containing protein alpha [Pancytospora philotis]|nr:small glutamine-rich tetratricopeptide repeat-containing protein alpha [Pancytospora philotis]
MDYSSVRTFFEARRVHLPAEDYQKVMSVLGALESKESPAARQRSEEIKERGNEAYKSGDLEKALELYGEAIAADPLNAPVYSNKALVCSKLGKDEEGIEACLAGLRVDPSFIKFYIRIGLFYMKTDSEKAHDYFLQGLERDPSNQHLKDLAAQTGAPAPASGLPDFEQLVGNPAVQDAVKNFVKDKSPEELADMLKTMMGGLGHK